MKNSSLAVQVSRANTSFEQAIQNLRNKLGGELFCPSDEEYDASRRVFNAMIDRRPALIARPDHAKEMVAAMRFAQDQPLEVAVRGGGHSVAGFGTCDGGLLIDLARMRAIQIDPVVRTARVEGGATWGELDRATYEFGLATPGGIISTTGVAGLTLGGGFGHLSRKYGLTIDNLIEVEMVLADGKMVKANEAENPDLFWAVRGGGGNFGIVTAFHFRLHPVSQVMAGPMLWPIDQAAEVMAFYRDYITNAPEDISGFFAFLIVPPGPPFPEHLHLQNMCAIVWCYSGEPGKFDEIFQPVRRFIPPSADFVSPLPYPALQSMLDSATPPGLQQYWRSDFVNELSDQAIDLHVKYGSELPTVLSTAHLYPINGAVHRIGGNDTAFSYRDATWAEVLIGADPEPDNIEKISRWAKDYWLALHPYSAGGAYVNFLMDEGQERVKATYRENYERLAAVKQLYDPGNFFHINQNIEPGAQI